MKQYKNGTSIPFIGEQQKNLARSCVFTGQSSELWKLQRCTFHIVEYNAVCILTLDTGHHSSGWWKNPDYETCWHLSISFIDPETKKCAPFKQKSADKIVQQIFGVSASLAWCEPPYSESGRQTETWHYRLFVDCKSLTPLLPRGEVYSKELTEKGWKTFSEVKAQKIHK